MTSERDWRPQTAGWARIKPELPADIGPIRAVTTAAFGVGPEADIIDALRSANALTYSLVARHEELPEKDAVLGHVAFSLVTINGATPAPAAMGLGPVSVRPDWQKQGIGSSLIRAGLHLCQMRQVDLVFVLGEPTYYGRFGFSAALAARFDSPYSGEAFMALEWVPGASDGMTGQVRYAPPFERLDGDGQTENH